MPEKATHHTPQTTCFFLRESDFITPSALYMARASSCVAHTTGPCYSLLSAPTPCGVSAYLEVKGLHSLHSLSRLNELHNTAAMRRATPHAPAHRWGTVGTKRPEPWEPAEMLECRSALMHDGMTECKLDSGSGGRALFQLCVPSSLLLL